MPSFTTFGPVCLSLAPIIRSCPNVSTRRIGYPEAIRAFGWLIPAYHLPPDLDDVAVLRIVVRDDFSRELGESLVEDLRRCIDRIGHRVSPDSDQVRTSFHH